MIEESVKILMQSNKRMRSFRQELNALISKCLSEGTSYMEIGIVMAEDIGITFRALNENHLIPKNELTTDSECITKEELHIVRNNEGRPDNNE
jgi:hypothetical protein